MFNSHIPLGIPTPKAFVTLAVCLHCIILMGLGADRFKPTLIGGSDAPLNAYPWMAALYRNSDRSNTGFKDKQFCGGVLIHPYWVLTAAHCVDWIDDSSGFIVAFGNGDLENGITHRKFATLIMIHPEYLPVHNFGHDFALIRLDSPIRDINPIPINSDPLLHDALDEARIIGWGITEPLDFEQSGVARLQVADVPIVSNDVADPLEEGDGYITEAMIATGKTNPLTTAYPGDSGGPLLAPGNSGEPWKLMGVASFGDVCDPFNYPYTFYNNIASELDWIKSVAGKLSFSENPDYEYMKSSDNEVLDLTGYSRPEMDENGIPRIRFQIPPASGYHLELKTSDNLQNWESSDFIPTIEDWTVSEDGAIERIAKSYSQEAPIFAQGTYSQNASAPIGPFPLSPSSRLVGSLKRHATTGDEVNVFKLSFQNPGDEIKLRAWSSDGTGLILGLLERSEGKSRIVAENVSDYRYLNSRSQEVVATAKSGCSYFAFVEGRDYNGSYELSYLVNPKEETLQIETPVSGILEYSDSPVSESGHYSDTYKVASGAISVRVNFTLSFPGAVQLYNTYTSRIVSEVAVYEAGASEFLAYRQQGRDELLAIRIVNSQPDILGEYQISASVFSHPSTIQLGQTQHRAFISTPDEDVILDSIRITGSLPALRTYVALRAFGDFSPAFFILNDTDQDIVESGYDYCDVNAVKSFIPELGKTYRIVIAGEPEYLNLNYTISLTRTQP